MRSPKREEESYKGTQSSRGVRPDKPRLHGNVPLHFCKKKKEAIFALLLLCTP